MRNRKKPAGAAIKEDAETQVTFWDVGPPEVDDPCAEWIGMPEFSHRDMTPAYSVLVHFRNDDDVKRFAELVGQTITDNTRFIWFPKARIRRYGEAT